MEELIKLAGNKKKTLHRAFDVCVNPMKALEEAIEIGFDTILTSGQKETALKEDTVACLDHAWLKDVELVISPYNWEVNGKTGVKAYLQKMTATAVEDEYYRAYEE